jgi:hypothetical protein
VNAANFEACRFPASNRKEPRATVFFVPALEMT